jgi:pyridoxal/pyridoxine/pyridoxamine kinase
VGVGQGFEQWLQGFLTKQQQVDEVFEAVKSFKTSTDNLAA